MAPTRVSSLAWNFHETSKRRLHPLMKFTSKIKGTKPCRRREENKKNPSSWCQERKLDRNGTRSSTGGSSGFPFFPLVPLSPAKQWPWPVAKSIALLFHQSVTSRVTWIFHLFHYYFIQMCPSDWRLALWRYSTVDRIDFVGKSVKIRFDQQFDRTMSIWNLATVIGWMSILYGHFMSCAATKFIELFNLTGLVIIF